MSNNLFRATRALASNYNHMNKKNVSPTLAEQFQKDVLPKVEHFCRHMTPHKAFLGSAIVGTAALPLSIFFAPTILAIPFDLALAVTMPFHMYYGTTLVIQDYVPRMYRTNALRGWAALSVISSYGLLKISICGPGIGASIKSLWAKPRVVEKEKRWD